MIYRAAINSIQLLSRFTELKKISRKTRRELGLALYKLFTSDTFPNVVYGADYVILDTGDELEELKIKSDGEMLDADGQVVINIENIFAAITSYHWNVRRIVIDDDNLAVANEIIDIINSRM